MTVYINIPGLRDNNRETEMKKLLAVAVLALVAAGSAKAQTANINATATVQTALTVTAGNALAFGAVFPGAPARTIDAKTSGASAGSFTMLGAAGAEVSLSFVLPATLDGQGGAAGYTLVPTFGATDAAFNTTNAQGTAGSFDPKVATLHTLAAGTGNGYVWIGGSVTAPTGQTQGTYQGTITLNAAYTGN
jgi:FtsH-binding integral membrane protein